MAALKDYITSIVPSWLSKPMGKGFLSSFGDEADGVASDALQAVEYGRIEDCANDGLNPWLRNSNLQVINGEAPAATRNVLRARWQQWRESGGKDGMQRALARLGYPNTEVWSTLDLQQVGVTNAFGGYVGFWFLLVRQPAPIGPGVLWDGGERWDDGSLYDLSGITRSGLDDLIQTAQEFKPATSSLRFIAFDVDGTGKFFVNRWGGFNWGAPNQWGAGLTGNLVIVPVHERWELQPNGAYQNLYNYSYLVP